MEERVTRRIIDFLFWPFVWKIRIEEMAEYGRQKAITYCFAHGHQFKDGLNQCLCCGEEKESK